MVCPPRFKNFDSRLEWLILDPETLPEIEARQKGVQACDRRSLTGILQCRSLEASWGGGTFKNRSRQRKNESHANV